MGTFNGCNVPSYPIQINILLEPNLYGFLHTGWPKYDLVLCMLLAWITVFLVISKGVKSSGKAAYFLALFPYVVIFVLLIRAVTLEGAMKGIIFFLKPKWEELLNPKVNKLFPIYHKLFA